MLIRQFQEQHLRLLVKRRQRQFLLNQLSQNRYCFQDLIHKRKVELYKHLDWKHQ